MLSRVTVALVVNFMQNKKSFPSNSGLFWHCTCVSQRQTVMNSSTGIIVGLLEGARDGKTVGEGDGADDSRSVGLVLGMGDGADEGGFVGLSDG